MSNVFEIILGIVASIGGFMDISELVFMAQAGAKFGYALLWSIALGLIGIILYSEMAGRIAAVTKKAVFDVIRDRMPYKIGFAALIASTLLNLLTCSAEIGGMGIALKLLTNWSTQVLITLSTLFVAVLTYVLSFDWLERVFGVLGMTIVVIVIAAMRGGPDINAIVHGFIPAVHQFNPIVYFYFAIGVIGSTMTPYEVQFYASGGVEEKWKPSDLTINRITAILGYVFGSIIAFSLVILSAEVFFKSGVDPQLLGTTALATIFPLGKSALIIVLVGMFFVTGGAAVEAALAGSYNIAQFFSFPWGKNKKPKQVRKFTYGWLFIFGVGMLIMLTGLDPVKVTEYSIIFSVVALPFTYVPILLAAKDKKEMGKHANGKLTTFLGWVFLIIISITAIAAIPLMIVSKMGQL